MTTEPTSPSNPNEQITAMPPVPAPSAPEPPASTPVASVTKPPAWIEKSDYVLLGLLLILSFLLASFTATNSELWLHLAIGQRLSEGTLTFGVDPFSWATEASGNRPAAFWVHHSWLYSWLIHFLYQLSGPSGAGLIIAKALLFMATIALLSRIGWTESNRWFVIICLLLAAVTTHPRLFLQPLVVSLFFLSVTMFVVYHAGVFAHSRKEAKPDGARWLWGLPVVFAVWANFDSWFILGPMLLGLCWAATGLARWFPTPKVVPGKTLGMVFGVGLAACLLNPFHIRVFQLPPELAYLLISVTEPLGVPWPDALVAGGRTLKELSRADPNFSWAISTMSSNYWKNPNIGMNIAGLAFFPLLLLGLLSFTLTALVKPQPGAPTLHLGRFLPWLVFAIMAVALYRLIPLFALVAAPLTAMTLGEFLVWQQKTAAISATRRDRGLSMARFVSVPFVLLLLFMAWPGWIKGPSDFDAPNRVAWQIRPDPSGVRAAETIDALRARNECGNVFNASFDIGNYLAWSSPNVKYCMDTRFALYVNRVADFTRAKEALAGERQPEEWQSLFKAHQVDQIVMVNFLRNEQLLRWWLDADHWRQRYGDNRIVVLSWAGPGKTWPIDTAIDDWNRQAFGPVPASARPPARGTIPAPPLSFWSLYFDGIPPQPAGVAEATLMNVQYRRNNEVTQMARGCSSIAFCASLTGMQATPGGAMAMGEMFSATAILWTVIRPLDLGPPALPILMVRTARRAFDENPHDTLSQLTLIDAIETLRRSQEDHWIAYDGSRGAPHPSVLRDRLRQYQLIASLYNLTQLQPRHPRDPVEQNLRLAQLYQQQSLFDLALDHQLIAEKALEAWKSSDKDVPKGIDAGLKQMHENNMADEKAVRHRLAKWKELAEGKKPLEQAALAYLGVYDDLRGNEPVKARLGLGKKALEILGSIDRKTFNEQEVNADMQLRYELLLAMGRADILAQAVKSDEDRKKVPGQYQLFIGGVLGDYALMEQGLGEIEKGLRRIGEIRRTYCVPALLTPPAPQAPNLFAATLATQFLAGFFSVQEQENEMCNMLTLRGILTLELGDTLRARESFKAALDEAGDVFYFSERPIAQRYFGLLEQQKKRDQ